MTKEDAPLVTDIVSDHGFVLKFLVEGIAKGSFSRWIPQVAVDRPAARDEGAFVKLTGPRSAPVASLGAGELELFLPGGVRLRWKV